MQRISIAAAASLFLTFTISTATLAQEYTDGRSVVQASYEKTGGVAWSDVKTLVQTTSVAINTPQGDISGSGRMTFLYPGYMHARMVFDIEDDAGLPMGAMTQVMTPDSGYAQSDMGRQELPGAQAPNSPNEDGELLKNDSAEVSLESYDLNGEDVYRVVYATESDTTTNYYDKETLYKVATEVNTPQGPIWVHYDDYREVGGLLLPHKITQEMAAGMRQILTINSIEVNPEIDQETLFGM